MIRQRKDFSRLVQENHPSLRVNPSAVSGLERALKVKAARAAITKPVVSSYPSSFRFVGNPARISSIFSSSGERVIAHIIFAELSKPKVSNRMDICLSILGKLKKVKVQMKKNNSLVTYAFVYSVMKELIRKGLIEVKSTK
jgi:hypothetical protein